MDPVTTKYIQQQPRTSRTCYVDPVTTTSNSISRKPPLLHGFYGRLYVKMWPWHIGLWKQLALQWKGFEAVKNDIQLYKYLIVFVFIHSLI